MKTKEVDEILNKIDTNFIFKYSKLCFEQLKIMEHMLKEESEIIYENQT